MKRIGKMMAITPLYFVAVAKPTSKPDKKYKPAFPVSSALIEASRIA
jgi:hypothetical protein